MAGPVIPNIQAHIADLEGRLAEQQARPVQNEKRAGIIANLEKAIRDAQANLASKQEGKARNQAYGEAMRGELAGAVGQVNAQSAFDRALLEQEIGFQKVRREGDIAQSQRDLESMYRQQEADYGGRDMLRSGVYQRQVALGEEENAAERAQVIAEYNQEIAGLEAQIAAGADMRVANVLAERARIRAAYRLARLG